MRGILPAILGLVVFCASTLGSGTAVAMTADGTLLTNAAMVSFWASKHSGVLTPLGRPLGDYPPSNIYFNPRFVVSYLASANVLVSFPIVAALKTVDPPDQGAGGLVTYRLWVINSSSWASAFNVTFTDIIPENMQYAGGFQGWDGGSGGIYTGYYSLSGLPATWVDLNPGVYPQDTDIATSFYLRWILSRLGPGRSALVEFWAKVE